MFRLPAPHHRFPRSTVLTVPGTYLQCHKNILGKMSISKSYPGSKNGFQIIQNSGPQRVTKKKKRLVRKSHHHSFQQNIPTNRAICHKYLRRMHAKCGVQSVSRRQFSTRSFGTLCGSFFFKNISSHMAFSR